MSDKPTMLSRDIVARAMADPAIASSLPEILPLKAKFAALTRPQSSGCSSCAKKKVEANMVKDFVFMLCAMDAAGHARVKQALGVSGLMYSMQNPRTGAYETRSI